MCTLQLLVCEFQVQFDMFDVFRKLFTTWNIKSASWREETPQTPQQDDAKSCGVYVLKVGLHLPAISTRITDKVPFRMKEMAESSDLKVIQSRGRCPYDDDLYYGSAKACGILKSRD